VVWLNKKLDKPVGSVFVLKVRSSVNDKLLI
jgi:hypothetical protein